MGSIPNLALITLFAPLVASVLIALFTLKQKKLSGLIALGSIVAGLVATVMMAMDAFGGGGGAEPYLVVYEIDWLSVGETTIPFGVQIDALSIMMSLVVTGVGACIFLFSIGYMSEEEGYSRYFACLSLFAFSMLGIVFSTNLVQTFIFWELVGVSSYSLIGYYFHKPSAVEASKKAFLTNRIGDFGMMCGILLLFYTLVDVHGWDVATFSFAELRLLYEDQGAIGAIMAENKGTLALATLLIFTGAVAKSAQVPLHVWLPDAMEGPTPVSALMHAATMVAAGVYLVSRLFFMFAPYPQALAIVAWMGGITALLAAGLAFVQFDIKKVLAYSTLSQLGYMVLALGMGSPAAAMFHLTTHACFKALLFLGSGSVIHGCHHEQDMRQMGGLFGKMKITASTFWIGTLALAGVFPLAGFFSKDAILGAAWMGHVPGGKVLFAIAVLVAFMTAAYMGRQCFMTFHGEYRGHAHPHESPKSMTIPLVILAVLSVGAGALSIPKGFIGKVTPGWLEHSLTAEGAASWFPGVHVEVFHGWIAAAGTAAAALGLLVSWLFYAKRAVSIDAFVKAIKPLHTLLENKYYFDDAYGWLVGSVQQPFARLCNFFELYVLRWLVDTFANLHKWVGGQIRLLLDGHVHRYVTMALVGLFLVLSYVLVGN